MSISQRISRSISRKTIKLPTSEDTITDTSEAAINLLPTLDFTEWTQSGVFGMTSVTPTSFTNTATAGISKELPVETGKSYRVTMTLVKGSGALRLYLSGSATIDPPETLEDLQSGEVDVVLIAYGPWLTFRASVGDGTNIITNLSVVEV